jgi:hypothetical protein
MNRLVRIAASPAPPVLIAAGGLGAAKRAGLESGESYGG